MASTLSFLRRRWLTPEGRFARQAVVELIASENAPRTSFEQAVAGLPASEEVEGFVDLRGIPFGGGLAIPDCTYFDLSFAQKPPEVGEVEIHLGMLDYRFSRFRDMRTGIGVLGGKISFADFGGSTFRQVYFELSKTLEGVTFVGASLRGGSFKKQVLSGCDFRDARLKDVDFLGVSLRGCDFRGARLSGCAFLGCEFDASCRLSGATVGSTEGWPGQSGEDGRLYAVPTQAEVMAIAANLASERPEFALVRTFVSELPGSLSIPGVAGVDLRIEGLPSDERAVFELLMEEVRDELDIRAHSAGED